MRSTLVRRRIAGLFVAAAALSALTLARPAPTGNATARVTEQLSLAQLAGQRVIYSYKGLRPPPELLRLIREGRAAGVVFFADNIAGHVQLRNVVTSLENANAASTNPIRAPLLLMTDQEGGQVRRLTGPPRPSEEQIGEQPDPEAAARGAGAGAAHNLASVGINVNLAPVLDVARSQSGFADLYGRSYSTDPELVAALGANFITALQKGRVAATAKHFPGLGAATAAQNTDLRPVTLSLPLGVLRDVDERPFESAIRHGVPLVMVSWAVYPELDPALPAGLSPVVVPGELRGRLGFTGVTITDALGAGALTRFGTTGRRGVLAAEAGMDLLLCSAGRVSEGEAAATALQAAYAVGTLDKAAFLRAGARILALRRSLGR